MKKNSRSKKILKLLLYTAMFVWFVLTALAGAWLWYMPHTWIKSVKNDFLLRNQLRFRVSDIRPGNFNGLYIQQLELGESNSPLLQAPHGSLTLELLPGASWNQFAFKQLELNNTPLRLYNNNGEITLNNLPLNTFIQELTKLPPSPDGRFIPLRINGTLFVGSRNRGSSIRLEIRYFPDSKLLHASASWRSKDTLAAGSWDAQINLASNIATGTVKGDIPVHFFQELQLRSDVPTKLLTLLHQAEIRGDMQFSAKLPEWKITDSNFNGKISAGELRWYNNRFRQVDTFALTIRHNQRGTSWAIPSLSWHKPMPFAIQNISLACRKNQSAVTFQAECDLLQSAVNSFCCNLQLPSVMLTTRSDKLTGQWDLRTNRWELSGTALKNKPDNDIQVSGNQQTNLSITPKSFSFLAAGTGDQGKISQTLEFNDLLLQYNNNKFQADRGAFFINIETGKRSVTVTDSLEFNFGNFTADTQYKQWSLPGFAGQINLRKLPDDKQELYLICRGRSSHLLLPWGDFTSGAWQLTANLEQNLNRRHWKLSGIDFTVPDMKTSYKQQTWEATHVALRGNGELLNNQLQNADLLLSATQANNRTMSFTNPEFKLNYDSHKKLPQRLQTDLKCRMAEFKTPWNGIKKALDCQVNLCGTSWFDYRQQLDLKAQKLEFEHSGFTGNVDQLHWQQIHQKNNEWDYQVRFAALQADSPHKNLGRGSFSRSSLSLKASFGSDGRQIEQLNLIGELAQPAWGCGSLQLGGENMQCSAMFNRSNLPQLQVQANCNHANILGKYFSAVTPELSCTLSSDTLPSVSGKLKFAPGNIAGAGGSLELQNAQFELPVLICNKPDKVAPPGQLTAEKLLWQRQVEGKFSAGLQHKVELDPGNGTVKKHSLSLNGIINSDKFAGTSIKTQANWQLSPSEPQMRWQLEMPESRLQEPLELNKYFSLPIPLNILKGRLGFQTRISSLNNEPLQTRIKFNTIQSDWQAGSLLAENLATSLELTADADQVTMSPHDIVAERIQWQNFEWKNNVLKLSITPVWQLLVSGWEGSMLGGKIQLTGPVTFDAAAAGPESVDMQFNVQDLPAGEFFRLINMGFISSDMLISGKLHPYWENGRLFFKSAHLSGSTPAGRMLKITPESPDSVRIPNQQHRGFTLAVLKAMKCYRTSFEFSTNRAETLLNIKAEGVPAQPVPFVYQGNINGNPFRPAEPGEQGFDGELEMNVKFKIHPALPEI